MAKSDAKAEMNTIAEPEDFINESMPVEESTAPNTGQAQNGPFKLPGELLGGQKVEFRFDGISNGKAHFTGGWYKQVEIIINEKMRRVTEPTSGGIKLRITRKVGMDKASVPYDFYEGRVEDFGWWKREMVAADREQELTEPKDTNHVGYTSQERYNGVKAAAKALVDWVMAHEQLNAKRPA